MKCPIDQTDLVITERQGIEIDYCPKCRGVWLDRGELDKLIDRSTAAQVRSPEERGDKRDQTPHYEMPRRDEPRYRKRKSLLSELFDF